jgi:resuscitation-promoting factor RpfA
MSAPQPHATVRRWLLAAATLGMVVAATGLPSAAAVGYAGANQNAAAGCNGPSTWVDNAGTGLPGQPPSMLTPGIAAWHVCDPDTRDGGARSARDLKPASFVAPVTPPAVLPHLSLQMALATFPKQPQLGASLQPSSQSTTTYSVRVGDCLSDIATSHNIPDWQQLYAANRRGISNPDLIYPGQLLRLPTPPIAR